MPGGIIFIGDFEKMADLNVWWLTIRRAENEFGIEL